VPGLYLPGWVIPACYSLSGWVIPACYSLSGCVICLPRWVICLLICLPGTLVGREVSWYTPLGIPPCVYIPVYTRIYASLPCTCRYHPLLLRPGTHQPTSGDDSFILPSVLSAFSTEGFLPFSPQEITLLPEETGLKRPTNPAQKAPAHKDHQNIPTPLIMLSDPPPCYEPPFHTDQERLPPPARDGLSAQTVQKSVKSGTFPRGNPRRRGIPGILKTAKTSSFLKIVG